MKKSILSFVVILFLSQLGSAQILASTRLKKKHLSQLKIGVLLVQLPNSDKKIAKLKELGQDKRARVEEKEINLIRSTILKGFEQRFKFCQFLFFERKHTSEILEGNYEHVFDANLKPVMDFPKVEYIYVAQYGRANPKDEVYHYNGIGIQIKYVNEGHLETINHDYFYQGSNKGWFVGQKKDIFRIIKKLNYKLMKG